MIKDMYPNKSQYFINQKVYMCIESEINNTINLEVFHLEERIYSKNHSLVVGDNEVFLGSFPEGGYEVRCLDVVTAFDVLEKSSQSPRYGFVSDFSSFDFNEGLLQMNKLHLTLIQFYDWMYRHHELVPKERFFVDPMKRTVDKEIIQYESYCLWCNVWRRKGIL